MDFEEIKEVIKEIEISLENAEDVDITQLERTMSNTTFNEFMPYIN